MNRMILDFMQNALQAEVPQLQKSLTEVKAEKEEFKKDASRLKELLEREQDERKKVRFNN